MKSSFCLTALICLFCFPTFAQDLRENAGENPLDCALFLISNRTDSSARNNNLSVLAGFYWKANRQIDSIKAIESISDDYIKTRERIRYANELFKIGEIEEARRVALKASQRIERDWSGNKTQAQNLLSILIKLDEVRTAIDFAESFADSDDKAFALIQIADLIAVNGKRNKAIELLSRAIDYAESSEWQDLKLLALLKIANFYAENAEREKALQLLVKVVRNYQSIELSNVAKDDFIEALVECYANLKDFDKALDLLTINSDFGSQDDLYRLAQLNQRAGYKEKSDALFLQIEQMQDSRDKSDGYVLSKIINDSLKENNYISALSLSKKISSEYYQLKIVDDFIKQGKDDLAVELLTYVLGKVKKIVTDAPESSLMSTSPQMQKAYYLSEIARKHMALKQFDTALKIINSIEKPYFKAQSLINLAETHQTNNSSQLLNQALLILRKTKSSMLDAQKFNVWCEIAVSYANIGEINKSLEIFSNILSDKDLDDGLNDNLSMIGYYFEKSGLKADGKVRTALQQIINNWEDDN